MPKKPTKHIALPFSQKFGGLLLFCLIFLICSRIEVFAQVKKIQSAHSEAEQTSEQHVDGTAATNDYVSQLIRTIDTSQFSNPSPDPSGLTYISERNALLFSDSEVEEFPDGAGDFTGATLWESGLSGSLVYTANISNHLPSFAAITDEPTGIAWNPNNGHYYVSDDSGKEIFDINPGMDQRLGTVDDSWRSFDTEIYGNLDPEGIAFDSVHNHIFVVDGEGEEVYQYTTSGGLIHQFDVALFGVSDPEGIEFNSDSATLFVLSNVLNPVIVETTMNGEHIRTINIAAATPIAPAGLTYAPASDGSGTMRFYITDRGIDNNSDPTQNDGRIYEMSAPPPSASANLPPVVAAGSDQTITLPATAMLTAMATDDGLPNPPGMVTTLWNLVSGPGSVTLANATAQQTVATFSAPGIYRLRISASDGQLSRTDDVLITVNEDSHIEFFQTQINAKSDDAEENTEGVVRTDSVDLEMIRDITDQIVGLRFKSVTVPAQATIRNAYVQFQVDEVQSSLTSLIVQGELTTNAQTFVLQPYNISNRTRTSAQVVWDVMPWSTIGEAAAKERTPNLATVIQEIVTQSGWSSGNSIAIIISGTGHRTAVSNEGGLIPNGAPKLYIEYKRAEFTTPTPTPSITPIPTQVINTATSTPTLTPTNSATFVLTATPSATATPQATQTMTPISTSTPTSTLTPTPTSTGTTDVSKIHTIYLPIVRR